MVRRYLVWVLLTLLLCVGILFYQGPGQPFIRGFCGDVVAVGFLYALLSMGLGIDWHKRLLLTLIIAFALEGAQWLQVLPESAPRVLRVLLGSHFDPLDLVAYCCGALIVALAEWRYHRSGTLR